MSARQWEYKKQAKRYYADQISRAATKEEFDTILARATAVDPQIGQPVVSRDEADQYLSSYLKQTEQYQKGLAPALQNLMNSKYLTQEDFAKYAPVSQETAYAAGLSE